MRVFRWAHLYWAYLLAQPVDISQQRVDPLTFTFEDGRTTLADYVLSQLRQHSSCCGVDNVYIELRITPEGTVESVRAMTGRNDCYKQSVRDILQPIRWKVENFRTTRPIYYELRFSEECKGTEGDNVYKPISTPGASRPVAQSTPPPQPESQPTPPKTEAPAQEPTQTKPIALTPSLPGTAEPKTPPAQEEPVKQPVERPEKTRQSTKRPSSAEPLAAEPARKGYQPGKEPPKEAQPPNPPALIGRLPSDSVPRPLSTQVPKQYQSTGEKRPPSEHVNSYVNTSGPRFAEPDYVNGPVAKALYLKQEYRKRGVCGLVHVLLEVAIDSQGNIRGYRILRANRPDVEIATPQVLAGMKYKPVPLPTVFYAEFKIDVDCQTDQRKIKLDTVPDFLSTPEGKLIRPAQPQP
ncbi:MAG: hypothetical protein N2170_03500 [Bacteroidia bacterium]|nr:hypothetical protein [Bacteroidia bacterium]